MDWGAVIGGAVFVGAVAWYVEHVKRETERTMQRKMDALWKRLEAAERELSRVNGRMQIEADAARIRELRSQAPRDP